jgi:hypothetical protein
MKRSFLFVTAIIFAVPVFSQTFKKDDMVQVDPLQSESKEGSWQNAEVTNVDTVAKNYTVKLSNGDKITIPSKDPEKWIRPVTNLNGPGIYGPSGRFAYQNRSKLLTPYDCRASEKYIKKNTWIQLAWQYKDYHAIAVEFTSFKAQNGYEDKEHKKRYVYPYKIEMLVHLKRTVTIRGKEYTEYQTWEFDRTYEYATRPGKKCEFYLLPSSDAKLLFGGWY